MLREEIELLAPARTADIGIAAINCGADAVYIGADRFGARAAAGNSVQDIARLSAYAHRFRAKVFVTVNTLLTDAELEQVEVLIWQLYEAGVDAIIVQDTRITKLNLPPIELHASTQCDIRTLDRVRELETMGFRQVVLARELSIGEIANIARNTSCVVETFVHGALCVSYSGRCFMSEKVCGRSANRGECAQMCRLPYDLLDQEGNVLLKNKYLLSLKDFNASDHLEELINAGVRSFKIEGRLKDEAYVKNIVGFYRQRLDAILDHLCNTDNLEPLEHLAFKPTANCQNQCKSKSIELARIDEAQPDLSQLSIVNCQLSKASLGQINLGFTPDITRTFYRGGTDYFLTGERKTGLCTMVTGKALGKKISPDTKLNNGDGVCWLDPSSGELKGALIDGTQRLPKGIDIYRNNDIEFERLLKAARPERRIPISINVSESKDGFIFEVPEYQVTLPVTSKHEPGRNAEMALNTWRTELTKLGTTEFICSEENVTLNFASPWFVPRSLLSDCRRQLVSLLQSSILEHLEPLDNLEHLEHLEQLDHLSQNRYSGELMRCRYCIRAELGICLKNKTKPENLELLGRLDYLELTKLYLRNSKGRLFQLEFDCHHCEMIVKPDPRP